MTGNNLIDALGLRLDDPSATMFTDTARMDAINIAQKTVVNMIDNAYLQELETVVTGVSVYDTDPDPDELLGYVTFTDAFSTALPIRNGIVAIKDVTAQKFCTIIEPKDAKRLENSYLSGSATNPIAYTFDQKVYLESGTAPTGGIDIWYLVAPTDFTSSTLTAECVLNPSLHETVLDFAESQLWKMDGKADRGQSAYQSALGTIKVLNDRYAIEKPQGIGGKTR